MINMASTSVSRNSNMFAICAVECTMYRMIKENRHPPAPLASSYGNAWTLDDVAATCRSYHRPGPAKVNDNDLSSIYFAKSILHTPCQNY